MDSHNETSADVALNSSFTNGQSGSQDSARRMYHAVPPPPSLTSFYSQRRTPVQPSEVSQFVSSSSFLDQRIQETDGESHLGQLSTLTDASSVASLLQAVVLDETSRLMEHAISSTLQSSSEYMLRLQSLILRPNVLQENGYVSSTSPPDLEKKKRCSGCGKLAFGRREVQQAVSTPVLEAYEGINSGNGTSLDHTSTTRLVVLPNPPRKVQLRCKFHDGYVQSKRWNCCNGHITSNPCSGNMFHIPRDYAPGELEKAWQYHQTPNTATRHSPRIAVAIDCEMGTAMSGDSELIRITLVDFFTSEILIDKLVYPNVQMQHYNTRYSGVTHKQMRDAKNGRQCFLGRDNARNALWQFVGPHTIVVGHSAYNDLTALRWSHNTIVDTYLIDALKRKTAEKKEGNQKSPDVNVSVETPSQADGAQQQPPVKRARGSGELSLKTLTKVRLGRDIQDKGKQGHDSLEDALASRDLAHWHAVRIELRKIADS